jgi:hypothetical protein
VSLAALPRSRVAPLAQQHAFSTTTGEVLEATNQLQEAIKHFQHALSLVHRPQGAEVRRASHLLFLHRLRPFSTKALCALLLATRRANNWNPEQMMVSALQEVLPQTSTDELGKCVSASCERECVWLMCFVRPSLCYYSVHPGGDTAHLQLHVRRAAAHRRSPRSQLGELRRGPSQRTAGRLALHAQTGYEHERCLLAVRLDLTL